MNSLPPLFAPAPVGQQGLPTRIAAPDSWPVAPRCAWAPPIGYGDGSNLHVRSAKKLDMSLP
jgi:hypothetical protein